MLGNPRSVACKSRATPLLLEALVVLLTPSFSTYSSILLGLEVILIEEV